MVVCKCRKATNLYCFVHKVPVCGECVCLAEHQICVVRTYSEWVIDGDYDWPPECALCHQVLQTAETSVTRLGCLHVLHSSCFSKHLQNFPPHTAPAGYTCPECSIPVWPPKQVKDQTCALSSQLKEAISQSGLSKTLLGNDISSLQQATPQTFASHSLSGDIASTGPTTEPEIKEETSGVNGQSHSSINIAALSMISSPSSLQPGAMTRKPSARADRSGLSHVDYDGEDEEERRKKYNHPGPLQKQAMKYLLPFSSNTSPMLPVTAPSRKDDQGSYAEEIIEGRHRRRSRSSGLNTKKILLVLAIMSCMVTMLLLYYRLLQGTPSEGMDENNQTQLQ